MNTVERFYNAHVQSESTRLDRHRMEFAVTLRALHEWLPASPAVILDIGGGPGRYAVALAQRGYAVTLLDLAAENLKRAVEDANAVGVTLADSVHGNALNLGMFADGAFDAVLMFGPLYHLTTAGEREQAITEALRVLKSGGIIVVAVITRFAPFRNAAIRDPSRFAYHRERAEHILATGIDEAATAFPNAYFAHPNELQPMFERYGIQTRRIIGCEGIIAGMEHLINELTDEIWETWVDWNYRLGQDPALYGAADHLLYIGYKP